MVKLVVADDEERVCRLIVALGNWEELGIKVVGTAANGIQALELIRKEKTDILITDIRMPGLNGLELIEKVREISPDIKIMIISGYANFEYAQNALKQGVSDYLLKPINKDALNAKPFERDGKQVDCSAVDGRSRNKAQIWRFRISRMNGGKNLSSSEICSFMICVMTDLLDCRKIFCERNII